MARDITRNSAIFFLSEGISAFLTMATGLCMARYMPVADFGKFTAALAFGAIVAILVDAGMGMLAAKEISRGTLTSDSTVDHIFSWRLLMVGVACLLSPWAARLFLPAGDVRWLSAWLIPGLLMINTTDFFCWIFKGTRNAFGCAGLQITSRALLLILCIVAVKSARPLHYLIAAYAIAGFGMAAMGFFRVTRTMTILRTLRLPTSFFKKTLPGIYKLGAILILSVAFTRVDIMLVARLQGNTAAGLYAAAGRIIDALRLIPTVIYSVYLPVFSAAHQKPAVLRAHFLPAYDVLLAMSTTLALIGTAWAKPLFKMALGTPYMDAAPCFQFLIWTAVLMFGNILMFSLHYALNDHRTPFIAITLALIVEITLDILWLPRFGLIAAAWARLTAECVNSLVMALGFLRSQILSSLQLILRPALLMGGSAFALLVFHHQPTLFRFMLTWAVLIVLAGMMGLGRYPSEEGLTLP